MRNRRLHDALREFALEAAALLCDDQRQGVELEFDLHDESGGRGPALYRYRPLTEEFIGERWPRLREMPSCVAAAEALGAGAAGWLRVNGLRGEQAEPALQAMLERLYEDATSFGFPEERFERVYRDVEETLYAGALPTTVVAPLPGLVLEAERADLGDGLSLGWADRVDAPRDALWSDERPVLALLERDIAPEDAGPARESGERFRSLVNAMRLLKPGGVTVGAVGWRRQAEGRWTPVELEPAGAARGEPWLLREGEERPLAELVGALERSRPAGRVGWALARFEMGCSRALEADALSDHLLALRALLDAAGDAGRASLPLRLAALCAEDSERRALQARMERALALERWLMTGGRGSEEPPDSPRALVEEIEGHLRALLRDVVCGYLDADLQAVADDILLEPPEPPAIEARDLRREEREPQERPLEGVTPSMDWDDPDGFSAPV